MATKVKVLRPINPYGKRLEVGAVLDMDEFNKDRYLKAGLIELAEEVEVEEVETHGWDLDITPKEYLARFPEGPEAERALNILALTEDETDTEE